MADQFTAAVLGTGFIGPVHVEGLKRAGVQVAGIAGSTPAKSDAAAETLGLPRGYASLDEILHDDDVDCVHLTTPNRFHFEQARAVLSAGKHVLCEKPLAMNSAESAELVRLADQSGRAAGVAYNVRFYPLCHEAAAQVRENKLGRLLHAHGSYVQDWLLRDTDFNWRVLAREGGPLRAVADIGTHWLDLIQFVTGQRVVSVFADLQIVHEVRYRPDGSSETFAGSTDRSSAKSISIDTEDAGCVLLRFDDGAHGSVRVSQTTPGRKNSIQFEIAGSDASLAWESERPNALWIGHRDRPNELLTRDPALMSPSAAAVSNYPGGHNEGFPDTFKQLFRAFYGSLASSKADGPSPYPTFSDGHHEILLCEAILASQREGRWVEVSEIAGNATA